MDNSMPNSRKILSIGHSYVVALNRRLVQEMAKIGQDNWAFTVVTPTFMQGDLRSLAIEPDPGEHYHLYPLPVYGSRLIHIMTYDWQLRQILQQDWDLVHVWEEPFILVGGQIAWLTPAATPLVFFTAQNNFKQYPPPFAWIERYVMHRAAGWIGCGQTGIAALTQHPHYAARPWRQIPHGVDTDSFYPNPAAGEQIRQMLNWSPAGPPVIGYLGRLVPEKGLSLLMRVLEQVKVPWRALFVGTGPMEAELSTWAAAYGDRIRICTTVRHSEVPAYLNAMDLLCAPSQTTPTWREQFGRMLVEAFACRVPVVGSDSGEIPYVLHDAGWIVAEQDEAAWVEAISILLTHPDKRHDLATRGWERAQTNYAWSVVAQQHLNFFQEILES